MLRERCRRYPANDLLHPNGEVQAVEVARFPSGNAFVRWFDHVNPKLCFDLVGSPDADEVRDMDPLIGLKLSFVGEVLTHVSFEAEPDVYDIGMIPSYYEEVKWFARYLGAPIGAKKGRKKRGWASAGRVRWEQVGESPATDLALDKEETEVFRMLGERLPILWDDAPFIAWAEERFSVK